jgi:hypothetical protein
MTIRTEGDVTTVIEEPLGAESDPETELMRLGISQQDLMAIAASPYTSHERVLAEIQVTSRELNWSPEVTVVMCFVTPNKRGARALDALINPRTIY